MRIRPATEEDQEAIFAVHERSVRGLAADAYDEEVLAAWTDLPDPGDGDDAGEDGPGDRADGQPENGRRYVAEVDSAGDDWTVVGFGDVRFEPPEYLDEPADGGVSAVYVDPDHAGAGVGSTLLERLETEARDRGLDSLGLLASVNAYGFYERHGYDAVADRTFQFGEDVEGPAVEMHKEL